MEFDRARNDEQRKVRVQQIKDAAIKLFDQEQFHEITLAKIANETSFTRGNLYKYIASKEEIYLLVALDEMRDWVCDLKEAIRSDFTNDVAAFAAKWAQITFQHQRFLKLISMLLTTIERNVSLEKLVEFKLQFQIELSHSYDVVKTAFPDWDSSTINKFIYFQSHFAIGLFPSASPAPIQQEAVLQCGLDRVFPDFVQDFSEFLAYTVTYMSK